MGTDPYEELRECVKMGFLGQNAICHNSVGPMWLAGQQLSTTALIKSEVYIYSSFKELETDDLKQKYIFHFKFKIVPHQIISPMMLF
jgi:hypothetical protein